MFGQKIFLKVATKFLMTKHCLHLTLDLSPQMDARHPITKHLKLTPRPPPAPPQGSIPPSYPSILCNKKCDNYTPSPNITHAIRVVPLYIMGVQL
jgi:hypothetical protein